MKEQTEWNRRKTVGKGRGSLRCKWSTRKHSQHPTAEPDNLFFDLSLSHFYGSPFISHTMKSGRTKKTSRSSDTSTAL